MAPPRLPGDCCGLHARVGATKMGSPLPAAKTARTNHIFKMIEIVVTPCQPAPFPKRWAGLFKARLGDRLLYTSRQPFLDGARILLAEGHDPADTISMRHAGRDAIAMTAKLMVAAKLTVNERGPYFERWRPMPLEARQPSEGSRIIALAGEGGCREGRVVP
jgi:hypothetical protein